MKTKSTLFLPFFIIPLFFTSCFSPRPVVRIEPNMEASKWNYGQAILEAGQDGIETSAAFAYSDPDFLVFDVEVTNWREERILISPELIRLEIGNGKREVSAIDPEKQMLQIEMDESRREANAKNAAVIAGVAAVAAVTTAAIAQSNNNNVTATEAALNTGAQVANVAPTVIIATGAVNSVPREISHAVDPWFWSDHTLRKTTLEKGEKVRGKVLFPRNDELHLFELIVPLEELNFTFEFKQSLHFP